MSFVINPYRFGGAPPSTDFGNASRDFDSAVPDYLTVADGAWIPTGAQTWMCWLKAETLLNAAVFNHNVGTGDNRSVAITAFADTSMSAFVSENGETALGGRAVNAVSSTGVYSTGTWVHVALVYTPNTATDGLELFIDGVSSVTESTLNVDFLYDSTYDIGIGANGTGAAPFNGKMADCRIYDAVLTAANIADIVAGDAFSETNLIGWWLRNTDDLDDYAAVPHDATEGAGSSSAFDTDGPLD